MVLKKLLLSNFRNIEAADISPFPGINVITGENAQGKTNLLESIFFISLFTSFRTSKDTELVRFDSENANIDAYIFSNDRENTISVTIPAAGRKKITLNNVRMKRLSDASGIARCVLFCPEDLSLVRASSARRRKFLDEAIGQLWPGYISALTQYNRFLSQKNGVLKNWRENNSLLDTLDDFSRAMCLRGSVIIEYRNKFIKSLSLFAEEEHSLISAGREVLSLEYKTVSNIEDTSASREKLFEELWEHYMSHKKAELASCSCLSGPHKDDMEVFINNIPARGFASQGQARTAALSLKLAQREMFNKITGEYPILLFDDVLSELDRTRQDYVLRGTGRGQVFITACEPDVCERLKEMTGNGEARVFQVEKGRVSVKA